MPFFEDTIQYLHKQKARRQRVEQVASDHRSKDTARQLQRLGVDYPWLSPGVAVTLAKGGYDPPTAKRIALEDLRSQYEENPAKFGDVTDSNPRKRLKSWIKEFDNYLEASQAPPSSSSAFDATAQTRNFQFQGITDDEIKYLRQTARKALQSGDSVAMTAALGVIGTRSTKREQPYDIAQTNGLTPAANWVADRAGDVLRPAVRTTALAANTLYEGGVAAVRTAQASSAVANAPTNAAAMGKDPLAEAQRVARQTQSWGALADASHRYGPVLGPFAAIGSQTQGGQALDALVHGQPVDVGDGLLPSPESKTGQEAAAAARRYSPYLIDGHAWTPGRATANIVFSPDSTAFTVLSGLVDAAVAMKADPSAAALAALGDARRAATTFTNVDDAALIVRDAETLASSVSRWRAFDRVFDTEEEARAYATRQAEAASNGPLPDHYIDGVVEEVPGKGKPEGYDIAVRDSVLAQAGGVEGRRPLIRGKNPIHWLYGDGAPIVTKLTEETDPWTIWNATNRKFNPELVARLADSTDEGVTRQILAGELGTSIDRVPQYQEGLGIKSRMWTDMPSGKLDLKDTEGAAKLVDDYLVLAKAPESVRQQTFNNLVRSIGRGDDYAVVDAVFDSFRESMIAAGAPADKAEALTKWTRAEWESARQWGVDAATGDQLPMQAVITNADGSQDVLEMPFGPRWPSERFSSTIDMPDARAVKRLVVSPEFQRPVNSPQWAGAVGLTDKGYAAWKIYKLLRPAWTVKVVGDEQFRIAATGNKSLVNGPMTAIAIALGNPQEGTWFGKSWYERIEGIGRKPSDELVQSVLDSRAQRAAELRAADPTISSEDTLAILNKELPIPRSVGSKASAALRGAKYRAGKIRTDITFSPWDARAGAGGDYAAGLTGRFSDFGRGSKSIYLNHFDVVGRDSEHWARAVAEDIGRMGSEPVVRKALRLTPEEFKAALWDEKWGKYAREQMAAGRKEGDPWLRVINDRNASDAYGDMILSQIENFIGNDEGLRVALVNGQLDGTPLVDEWGRATEEGINKLKAYQVDGRGPDNVKVERVWTQKYDQRETDMSRFKVGINSLFDALMTRPSNYLSRHPAFAQKYWGDVPQMTEALSPEARARLAQNLDRVNLPKEMEQNVRNALAHATSKEGMSLEEADDILKRRALDYTRDTLYDLSKKSNVVDSVRFVFPFGEAFKEILTVWARLAVENPQVARRVQQGIQGAREAVVNPITGLPTGQNDPMAGGFFRYDPQTRQEVFTVPLTGALTKLAFGQAVPLKSPVQGLNMVGSLSPGAGPLLSIPAAYIIPKKPSYDKLREIVFPFGEPQTANPVQTIANEFTPTWAKYAAKALADPRSDTQYANTVVDIMAVKASTGEYELQGPNAHDEINRLMHDSTKAADVLFLIRAAAVATSPSAPGFDFYSKEDPEDPDSNLVLLQGLRDEYRKMVDKHGFQDGFVKFAEKFGVDNLLATSSKSTPKVAGLTTSTQQRTWARSNSDMVESYPSTWALFAPKGTGHSQTAYEGQIASGQRDPIKNLTGPGSPAEKMNSMLGQAVVQHAIDSQLGGEANTASERAYLRDLKAKVAREYPGYSPDFGGSENPARIRELERAAQDPKVKDTPLGQALNTYLVARDKANQEAVARGYSEVGAMEADKAAGLRDDLRKYVKTEIIPRVPEFKRMWQLVLEKELAS